MPDEFPPCLGCGYCCKKALCTLGSHLHGHELPCPSLTYKNGRYWCSEALSSEHVAKALYVGEGCCSSMNSYRQERLRRMQAFKLIIPMLRTNQVFLELARRVVPRIPLPKFNVGSTEFANITHAMQFVNALSYTGYDAVARTLLEACATQ
jgi:hypothetical protein